MAYETVTIVVGGFRYSTWESVDIEAGAKAARSFTFVAAEPNDATLASIAAAWPLAPGNPCQVMASGDLVVTGYIDDYAPEIETTLHKATITGRSKAADAIDSAAMSDSNGGCFQNMDMGQIAQQLDQFGIGYQALMQLDPLPMHQLVPGSTVHQELDVLARAAGALMIGNADGSVNITNAAQFGRHAGALIEGYNIRKASAKLSLRHKHSEVHVKGQARRGHAQTNLQVHQIATDSTVPRYRPKLIVHEGDTDDQRALKRAQWAVARESGYETTAEITVRTWRDEAGALWDPQKIIYVQSQSLKINQDMAIKNVKFHQSSEQGSIATLSLVDPQALGGNSAKGSSNSAWQTGGS